jgi:hypothetical protein
MSQHGLREGVGEIVRDPALLLIEIGWRWSFGAIAILVCALSAFLLLDTVTVDPRMLQAMAALNPLQLAQNIAEGIVSLSAVLWRAAFVVGLLLAAIWVLFSALGRYATLARPALKPGTGLQGCLVVSTIRAMLALASIAAWFVAGLFAAVVGSAAARSGVPNVGLMSAILLLAFLLILGGWSTLNWFFSLVPLTPELSWNQSVRATLRFLRLRRDELLEISIVNGILRAGLLAITVLLSIAASSVITNPRVLLADLLAIALLYFLVADFLYVARLIAFGKLREERLAQPASAVFSHSDSAAAMKTQAGTPVPHDAS